MKYTVTLCSFTAQAHFQQTDLPAVSRALIRLTLPLSFLSVPPLRPLIPYTELFLQCVFTSLLSVYDESRSSILSNSSTLNALFCLSILPLLFYIEYTFRLEYSPIIGFICLKPIFPPPKTGPYSFPSSCHENTGKSSIIKSILPSFFTSFI